MGHQSGVGMHFRNGNKALASFWWAFQAGSWANTWARVCGMGERPCCGVGLQAGSRECFSGVRALWQPTRNIHQRDARLKVGRRLWGFAPCTSVTVHRVQSNMQEWPVGWRIGCASPKQHKHLWVACFNPWRYTNMYASLLSYLTKHIDSGMI